MPALRSTCLHLVETRLLELDDEAMVARAKENPQAFADLYRTNVEAVYRHYAHRLGQRQAAEDATSRIYLKALTSIRSCRDGRAFRGWLIRIAHNTVTDSYRVRRPEDPIEAAESAHDRSRGPEETVIETDEAQSVFRLLTRLNPSQARILEHRLAGLTGPEVAQVLGCSLAPVKIGQVRGVCPLEGDRRRA